MPLITLEPGPRNAHTDAQSGLRFYRWGDRDLPSVTTIRRLAGMPFNLHAWSVSKVVTRAIEQHDELTRMLTRPEIPGEKGLIRPRRPREVVLTENRNKEAARWLRAAATEERDRAAQLGTTVHDAATGGKALADVEPAARARLRQFQHWHSESGARIVAVEKQVFNLTLGYAGTFDILAILPDKRVALIDIKTGKGTYMEHALQLQYYSMAEFIGEDNVIDERLTRGLKAVTTMAVLHLTDSGWKWQEVEPSPLLWGAAKGLLAFAAFAHANPTLDTLVADEEEGVAVL